MENTRFKISQYACAVLLIVSSIALVAYQVVHIDDVAGGLLVYVAQAFLLVACQHVGMKPALCRISLSLMSADMC